MDVDTSMGTHGYIEVIAPSTRRPLLLDSRVCCTSLTSVWILRTRTGQDGMCEGKGRDGMRIESDVLRDGYSRAKDTSTEPVATGEQANER